MRPLKPLAELEPLRASRHTGLLLPGDGASATLCSVHPNTFEALKPTQAGVPFQASLEIGPGGGPRDAETNAASLLNALVAIVRRQHAGFWPDDYATNEFPERRFLEFVDAQGAIEGERGITRIDPFPAKLRYQQVLVGNAENFEAGRADRLSIFARQILPHDEKNRSWMVALIRQFFGQASGGLCLVWLAPAPFDWSTAIVQVDQSSTEYLSSTERWIDPRRAAEVPLQCPWGGPDLLLNLHASRFQLPEGVSSPVFKLLANRRYAMRNGQREIKVEELCAGYSIREPEPPGGNLLGQRAILEQFAGISFFKQIEVYCWIVRPAKAHIRPAVDAIVYELSFFISPKTEAFAGIGTIAGTWQTMIAHAIGLPTLLEELSRSDTSPTSDLIQGRDRAIVVPAPSRTIRHPNHHHSPGNAEDPDELKSGEDFGAIDPDESVHRSVTQTTGDAKRLLERGKESPRISVRNEADRIRREIDEAMSPLVDKINAYLKTLVGRHFPVTEAQEDVDAIRRLVERAGCGLFFGPHRVWISVRTRVGKNASFHVGTRIDNQQHWLHRSTDFPVLHVRPLGR